MIANLFLIGAPKSGTTSVANSLGRHPDIFLPFVKEPNYFGSDTGEGIGGLDAYAALYEDANSAHFRLDASAYALQSVDAIEHILQHVPDAQFIVLLRDPVDAVPAFHSQLRRHFVEPEIDFESAWDQQIERKNGKVEGPLYYPVFDYGRQIERLTRLVPKDRYRIYSFNTLRANGTYVIHDILKFLKIDIVDLELSHDNVNVEFKFRRLHSYKQALAPKIRRLKILLGIQKNLGLGKIFLRWNTEVAVRKPLSPHVTEKLTQAFAKDYDQVKKITGINLRSSTPISMESDS